MSDADPMSWPDPGLTESGRQPRAHGVTHVERRVKRIGIGLTVVPFVAAILRIWTGDDRWLWTALVLIPFGLVGVALIGLDAKHLPETPAPPRTPERDGAGAELVGGDAETRTRPADESHPPR
jgi:hypothetical protein